MILAEQTEAAEKQPEHKQRSSKSSLRLKFKKKTATHHSFVKGPMRAGQQQIPGSQGTKSETAKVDLLRMQLSAIVPSP